ncbi:MAG TPA: hypothetical protein VEZ20_06165 [Allosphingosinicella sp.]|nr:hypothetical protein [Allosphingosinicella sp.]
MTTRANIPAIAALAERLPEVDRFGPHAASTWSTFARLCLLAAALLTGAAPAAAQEPRPLARMAEAVTVRGYPLAPGTIENQPARRRAALDRAVADLIAERGEPLTRDSAPDTESVQFVYPDAVSIFTSDHSNEIVCRVDIAVSRLAEEASIGALLPVAAQACRNAELRSGAVRFGPMTIVPLGSEPLAGAPDVTFRLYATEMFYALDHQLFRNHENERRTRILLVRDGLRFEGDAADGRPEWRYAWFADGTMLVLRHVDAPQGGESWIGFTCAATGPAARIPPLGPNSAFARWCDRHGARLRPGIANFAAALRAWRIAERERMVRERAAAGDTRPVPPVLANIHNGEVPAELGALFWRTGAVPPVPKPR